MRLILGNRSVYVLGAILLIGVAVGLLISLLHSSAPELVTATVDRGDVRELVSVSGVVEAENTAKLAFPVTGIVRSVTVSEGEYVETGEVLATIEQSQLLADRKDALAALSVAKADRDELVNGPRSEARDITNTTVTIKESELEQIKAEEAVKVENALRTLLSTDLEAVADDPDEDAVPPIVSGSYACADTGDYTLSVYGSGSDSGYSFQLAGLESGTYSASIDQPSRIGVCGLKLLFDGDSLYYNSKWTISIPNTKSASYAANLNAYNLAVEQSKNSISDAEQALTLAKQQQTLDNADPRTEALAKANAVVAQAEARLDRVNAQIEDRTLRAPFSGTITNVDILPGETVSVSPVITLLADNEFKLTARIPEIDVTKIVPGQTAEIVFDARTSETLISTVDFISPLATEIDGVAYYEAHMQFAHPPTWLKSGLNADVDIIVNERINVLRLPNRFITKQDDGTYSVLVRNGDTTKKQTIEVGIAGNDGYTEIQGLDSGTTVVAP